MVHYDSYKKSVGKEKNMIGKIQRIELRSVWPHEAHNFTKWLQENIDVINDAIDLNITNLEREKAAGDFWVDLVAEDDSGHTIIIENQLKKSDHDHLGKLITYLSVIGAKAAIWIVADPRPEHVRAVSWLNESSGADFYLLKLEAIQIENSPPAPLLTSIVGPSKEVREVGQTKKELAERHILRKKWWTTLLDRARKKTDLHANISATESNWIGVRAGKQGLNFNYNVTQRGATVELYIDQGKGADKKNKDIFDKLYAHKEKIEQNFGDSLDWERLDDKRASRIAKRFSQGGYRDEEEKWPKIQDKAIDTMICLEKALQSYIDQLP